MVMSLELNNVLTPKAQEVIDMRSDKSGFLHTVIWAHVVSGLLCIAIAAIDHSHQDVTEFYSVYIAVQMYHRAYSLPFNPMPDALELPENVYTTIMSPAAKRTADRPKKRRIQI
ncbi:hypothetical protein AMTR_s00109p00088630 [Amborella trichopoda]|uniref:Uncharacterized protein n=1 Tax=Amborella trichopoda TaxID=13333 RepID=W1NSF9_AMBTC|nr:hypothetical protein AMTR_s00109p00088630 [Amborella trichopoda]